MYERKYIPQEEQRHSVGDLVSVYGKPNPDIQGVFEEGGALQQAVSTYSFRHQQHQAAQMGGHAFRLRMPAIIEAGTGTGKSFATCVPAIFHAMEVGQPVILTTSSNVLIDQYANTDLPFLQRALERRLTKYFKRTFRFSVARGRSNFLCRKALHVLTHHNRPDKYADALELINRFERETTTGDLAGFQEFDLKSHPMSSKIVATRLNCIGPKNCAFGEDCFYYMAKDRWAQSDIIVTNHAMLAISLIMPGLILPDFDGIIVDEAHQLQRYVTDWLTTKVTPEKWAEIMAATATHLREDTSYISTIFYDWFMKLRPNRKPVYPDEIINRATIWMNAMKEMEQAKGVYDSLREHLAAIDALSSGSSSRDRAVWIDEHEKTGDLTICSAPTTVGSFLKAKLWTAKPAIITSATLCTSNGGEGAFDFAKAQLGADTRLTLQVASPFDWDRNCLYILSPQAIREADVTKKNSEEHDQWAKRWADAITPTISKLLQITQGKAFVICTTTAVMKEVHANLKAANLGFPLVLQDEMSKPQTIQWFKKTANPVLVATASYREGVDIAGDQLSCVIIDRVEFPNKGDHVEAARMEAHGDNNFYTYQIPYAITVLRQTVGRLIRTITDRGIVCILDPRLRTKRYGRQLLAALPGQAENALDRRTTINVTGFLAGDIDALGQPRAAKVEPVAQDLEEMWSEIEGNGEPEEPPVSERFLGVLDQSRLKTATRLTDPHASLVKKAHGLFGARILDAVRDTTSDEVA